ncbi:MAG: hypothetical protein JWN03_1388 [Nocardia sp.]|uniref:DUF397 domain-containing protein n=1 Tax=Nocardia sp. TaxID=1821 RepID=UPI002606E27A|nr:DUF397 domain-containing protein [Nocardia sp.]MCU1641113.1 hypothetical protein [Nocardia sp.]
MNVEPSGVRWFKSARSTGAKECVEIAFLDSGVGVRDSKNPTGPKLVFGPTEWDNFTAALTSGSFDPTASPNL